MITCKHATRLASRQLDALLGIGQRLALWLHLSYCPGCRRAARQFRFLQQACRSWQPGRD
ncbi:MAG: hypothetical protein RIR00_650 [Pseudomonadota bacterium]|jgi:hypothetical protein